METVSLWVGIVGPAAGLIGAWLVHVGAKRDSRRTGETEFRDDLIETISTRDVRIRELEQQAQVREDKIAELRDRIVDLAAEVAQLRGRP